MLVSCLPVPVPIHLLFLLRLFFNSREPLFLLFLRLVVLILFVGSIFNSRWSGCLSILSANAGTVLLERVSASSTVTRATVNVITVAIFDVSFLLDLVILLVTLILILIVVFIFVIVLVLVLVLVIFFVVVFFLIVLILVLVLFIILIVGSSL